MDNYLIIADDFTGANDTGVQLKKRGIKTNVILDTKNINDFSISYVIDTESRGLTEKDAYEKVKNQIKKLFTQDFELVYKKVDSTLRGNIVSEIKAVDEEYKPELIIFAPAFPDIKRTTIDGIQKLNDVRIVDTEVAKDPKKPVKEDNINKLLQKGFEEKIVHYGLNEIREKNISFKKGRVYTFDVENNEDMLKIVKSALDTGKRILWVGSAGMADSILKVKKPFKPSLGVVGSISDISRQQLKYAEGCGMQILKINISKLLKDETIESYISSSLERLNKGKDLIITSAYEREDYKEAVSAGQEKNLSKEEVSMYTQEILGEIAIEIIKRVKISGIFLTGGDTAIGFINKAKASGSSIVEEVITGIPLMKLTGGEFNGLKIITKAGAFGKNEAIEYCMRKLKEDI